MGILKVKINGLKEFYKDVDSSSRSFDQYDLLIGQQVMDFHYALARRTKELFNVPYSLNEVLIGKTVSRQKFGRAAGKYGLQYRDKLVKASEFPFTVVSSNAVSKAPLRKENGMVKWTAGAYSRQVYVSIRRNKSERLERNGQTAYARIQEGGIVDGIRVRRAEKTWNEFPTKDFFGNRDNTTSGVFGPSLSSMAAGVINNDANIQKELNKLGNSIANTYLKFYLNEK